MGVRKTPVPVASSPAPPASPPKRKGEKKAPLGGEAVPRSLSAPPSAVSNGEIVIYTDGACSGNPGPGGWAAVLIWNEHRKEISGYEAHTTNNRMELRAAIEALKTLKRKNLPVRIVTDSQYLMHAFTKNWLDSWIRKGWMTASREPVKNRELWEELIRITAHIKVQWAWTRGHALNELNNRCDELARAEIEKHR